MRAYLMLRPAPFYRRGSFEAGLRACGYEVVNSPPRAAPFERGDLLVIWNRYGHYARMAEQMKAAGGTVMVVENGLMGRDRPDGHWYSIALNDPAAMGGRVAVPVPGEDRRAHVGVDSYGLRKEGREVIVLASRGIGPPGIASPPRWTEATLAAVRAQTDRPVRLRHHPGEGPRVPLETDLADAWCVVTWASAAALQALLLGVPVLHCCPTWIGAPASAPWSSAARSLEAARIDEYWTAMAFEKVARGTWRTDEIESGVAIRRVLDRQRFTTSEGITVRSSAPVHSLQGSTL